MKKSQTDTRELMVTIRCLVYNHEPYLRQCLDGFVMQKTNFRFEAIVHDDASTDGSAEIIREYAEKYPNIIKPIFETENQYSKRDGSIRRIMNAHTHGKYVALCEGDDYWIDPLKLQKQVDFMEANPDCNLVCTRAKVYSQRKKAFLYELGENTTDFAELLTKNTIATLTVVYRKSSTQGFEDFVKGNTWRMGDYPLWLYISMQGRIHFINEVTSVYRLLAESASHSKSYLTAKNFQDSTYDIQQFFSKYCKKELNQVLKNNHYYRCFCLAFHYKEFKEAVMFYEETVNYTFTLKDKLKYLICRFCILWNA